MDDPGDPCRLVLNGEWDFIASAPDANRDCIGSGAWPSGREGPWADTNKVRKIRVPAAWESQEGVGTVATGRPWMCVWDCGRPLIRHFFSGEGWYARRVSVPAEWKGRRIWFKTGRIGNEGWFWLNGNPVGTAMLYCGAVKFEVTEFAKPGEDNYVVVQALNTGICRMGGLASSNQWGGILDGVELEATPQAYIDDCWVRGDYDGRTAEVHVDVDGAAAGGAAKLELRATVEGESAARPVAGDGDQVVKVPLKAFRPWSPESPNLYTAKVELVENGRTVQTRFERFGVRKLEVVGGEFRLNGKPFFVRGAGWHNKYPIDGTAPADIGMMRRIVRRIRDCGFNACRFHTHCPRREIFEAADEAGLLLEPELPYYAGVPANGQEFDPNGDAEELWRNYRGNPSFAILSGGNEGWFGKKASRRFYREAKGRDPDRLVLGNDGWNNRQTNGPDVSDFEGGPMSVWPRGSFNPERPFVCHEYLNLSVKCDTRLEAKFTGVMMPDVTRRMREEWLSKFGLDFAHGDRLVDAQARMQKIWRKYGIEQARLDPYCDGYSYWALVSGSGAVSAQLFDPFWDAKPCGEGPEDVARYNSPSCVLMDVAPRLYGPEAEEARFKRNPFEMFLTDFATNRVRCAGEGISARFYLAHYGERPLTGVAVAWRLVAGGVVLREGRASADDQAIGAVREVGSAEIEVPSLERAVAATLEVSVEANEGTVANAWEWWLFPRREKLDGRGVYIAGGLRDSLGGRFASLEDDISKAKTVVAPPDDQAADAARRSGARLITISGVDGEANIRLGWWWMGKQMGSVFENDPALRHLPHDGLMSPLCFRIMKDGAPLEASSDSSGLIVYGEGRDACYSYLSRRKSASGGVEYAVTGIDLLADCPEADAIFRGLLKDPE